MVQKVTKKVAKTARCQAKAVKIGVERDTVRPGSSVLTLLGETFWSQTSRKELSSKEK